jgi:adenine-specific DNA glycosylase
MRKRNRTFRVAIVVAAIALLGGAASSARAATFTVNATIDNGGFICVPAKPRPPQCALRDAVTVPGNGTFISPSEGHADSLPPHQPH